MHYRHSEEHRTSPLILPKVLEWLAGQLLNREILLEMNVQARMQGVPCAAVVFKVTPEGRVGVRDVKEKSGTEYKLPRSFHVEDLSHTYTDFIPTKQCLHNCTKEAETNILSTSKKGKINRAQVRQSSMPEALCITVPVLDGLIVNYRWRKRVPPVLTISQNQRLPLHLDPTS